MYRFRKFLKYLGYSLVYILISIASAYGVINLSVTFVKGEPQTGADTTLPTQITSMVEHFSTSHALDLNLSAQINANGESYDIGLDALVDLSQGIENIKAQGSISAIIGNAGDTVALSETESQSIDVNFSYQNNQIYLDMFSGKFMIQTDSLLNSLTQVLAIANVDLASMGVSEILNMPINDMLAMLSNIKEEVKDEESGLITMVLALPMVGDATLTCDSDYKLLGLYSDMAISEDLSITVSSGIDYPQEPVIEEKEDEEYINAGNLLEVLNPLLNYTQNTQFALDLNVTNQTQSGEYQTLVNGKLYLDIEEEKASLVIKALGNEAKLFFIDNAIYIEYQNVFTKFDLADLDKVRALLENTFNITLPQEVMDMINAVINGEEITLPNGVDLSSFDINSLDLSIIEKVEIKNNSTIITIKDMGVVRISTDDTLLSELAYSGFGYQAVASVLEYKDFNLLTQESSYIDLASFIPTIENAVDIMSCKQLQGQLKLNLEEEIIINFAYSPEKNIAKITTQLFGLDVNIIYQDNTIYTNVADKFKFATTTSTFIDDLLSFMTKIGVDMSQMDTSAITDKLAVIFNPSVTPLFITSLEETNNGFILTLFNDTSIVLENSTNALNISSKVEDVDISVAINGVNEEMLIEEITGEEYTDTNILLNMAAKVYNSGITKLITPAINTFSSNNIAFDVTAQIAEESLNLKANLDLSEKTLSITSSIYDLDFALIYQDGAIYIEYGNIYLAFDLINFNTVDTFLADNFDIHLPSELIGKFIDFINGDIPEVKELLNYINFDFANLDLSILDNIKVSDDNATITLDQNVVTISFSQEGITEFQFDGEVSASAKPSKFENKSLSRAKADYIDITTFIPTIENVNAIASAEKIYGLVNLEFDSQEIDLSFSYDSVEDKAHGYTQIMGIDVNIYYTNKKVYINVADKFKFVASAESFAQDIENFLDKINVDLSMPETNELLNTLVSILSPSINPALIKSYTQTPSGMVITLFNDVTFALTNTSDEIAINSAFDEGSIYTVLKTSKQEVVIPTIYESEYTNTNVLLDIVAAVYNSGLTTLITPTLNTLSSGNIGLDININLGEKIIPAELYLSLEDRTLTVISSVNNTALNIFYQNEIFFVEYGNLYFQVKLDSYSQIEEFLSANFGITLPSELICKSIEIITAENITIEDMLNSFELDFNLADFDLSFFDNITVEDNKVTITLGKQNVVINYTPEKVIGFEFDGITATLTDYMQTFLATENTNYIDLTAFLPTIQNTISIMENDVISGSVTATIDSQDITITFAYSQATNTASAYTQIYGINVNIYLVEGNVYVNVHDKFKFVSSTATFVSDIKTFMDKIGVNATVDTDAVLAEVANIFSPTTTALFVKNFVTTENGIVATLYNDIVLTVVNDEAQITLSSEVEQIPFAIVIKGGSEMEEIPTIIENEYTNTNVLLNLAAAAHNSRLTNLIQPAISTLSSGNLGATFDFGYEDVSVSGHLSINVADLSAGINVNVRGVDVNIVILSDDVIYVEFGNTYVKFALKNLPDVGLLLSKYFDISLPFDKILEILNEIRTGSFNPVEMLDKLNIDIDLESFDLAFFDSITLNENTYTVPVEGVGKFTITASDKLEGVVYNGFGFNLNAQLNEYKVFDLSLLKEEYIDLSDFLPTIDNMLDIISYNTLSGQIVIYDSELNLNIPIDYVVAKDSEVYVSFTTNIYGANISGQYFKEKVYLEFAESVKIIVDVNELPSAIQEVMESAGKNLPAGLLDTFDQILSIFLDGNTGSILSTAVGAFDSIKSIFDRTTTEMLIKSFATTESGIVMTLYNDIVVSIDNKTCEIDIATAIDYIDLDISIKGSNDRVTVPTLTDSDYIPIENILELVKAFFNMTNKDDFNIKGTLDVVGSLVGIDITMNIGVDAQVKIVDGKVQFQAILGEIPAIVGVNNDVPYKFGDTESGSDRYVYLYFDGGDLYIYRSENVDIVFGASKRKYEKCTKISAETLLADPMYYLQYMIGFTDTIMNEIEEAMLLAQNRENPIDLNNVVNSLQCNGDLFNIILNLAEIANNDLMDTLDLSLLLNRDSEDKSYIYRLGLDVFMPLAEDIFELNLSSDDLTLVDYGSTVDLTRLQQYVTSYKYNYGEEWEASDGSWAKASDKQYTIYFEENGGDEQTNITGVYGSAISLPTYTNSIVTDDGVAHTTATFAGWYTTSNFAEGTLFTETTMPRKDVTLYAKWNKEILYYRTIKFVTNSSDVINSITQLEGTTVVIENLTTKQETVGDETTTYSFGGWYTDSTCLTPFSSYVMPSQSIILYAKWNFVKTEVTKTFTLYDNNNLIYSYRIKTGDEIDLSGVNKVVLTGDYKTKFYLDSNYATEYDGSFIMPDVDLTLHVRNAYTLTVTSAYGNTTTVVQTIYQGESVSLPVQESYVYDNGVSRRTYTFLGYSETISVMPNENKAISALWNEDVKYYYTITFDMSLNYIPKSCAAGCSYKTAPPSIASVTLLEGETLDLTQSKYQVECKVWSTAISWGVNYTYKSTTWGTKVHDDYSDGGDGFTSYTVTREVGDVTLYPYWKKQ